MKKRKENSVADEDIEKEFEDEELPEVEESVSSRS